jgi:hypothetical protein
MHRPLPERIKRWYKSKSNIQNLQFSSSKVKKDMIQRKLNVKKQIKMAPSKAKAVIPSTSPSRRRTTDKSERIIQKTKEQLPTTTTVTSSKRGNERKGSLLKSRSKTHSVVQQEKKHSKILDDTKKVGDTSVDKNEKMKAKTRSQISIISKSKDQQKNTIVAPHNQPVIPSSTTITTDSFSIDNVSKLQVGREGINY